MEQNSAVEGEEDIVCVCGVKLRREGPASVLPPFQEGMLKDLQKSVEEEERVWKAKVGAAEEELQKVWLPACFPELDATALWAPELVGPGCFSQILVPDGFCLSPCSHGSQ